MQNIKVAKIRQFQQNNSQKMVIQKEIQLPAFPRGFHIITDEILQAMGSLPKTGIFHLFIKHTSAGLTINENADPSVRVDF